MDKHRQEEAPTGRKPEERRSEREKVRREKIRQGENRKMQVRKKGLKSQNTVFFPMICGSGGSKSRLPKVVGAEPAGQMRDEKFASQNVKNTTCSDHF